MAKNLSYKTIDEIIKKNIKLLRKPGVLTARPGYKMTGGWVTDKHAIVVTVDKKIDGLSKAQRLPAEIGDVPLDIREATGLQRLRIKWPEDFIIVNAHIRGEQREPDWKWERDVNTGKLVSEQTPVAPVVAPAIPPTVKQAAAAHVAATGNSSAAHFVESPTSAKSAAKGKSAAPGVSVAGKPTSAAVKTKAASVKAKKDQIDYTAPPKSVATLKKFTGKVTILAYASPDDGFTVLQDFLEQTKSSLDIAMYDFTSGDLLKTVEGVVKGGKVDFRMVLDHPPRNPTANQPDDETRTDILQAANGKSGNAGSGKGKAGINWALTRNDPVVTEWIYPTAYHIKVVVRDTNAFWLSSGNFNVSNQPNLKANDPKRGSLKNADRDWHVIVFQEDMAGVFNAFILNDFKIAQGGQQNTALTENVHAAIKKAMTNLKTQSSKSTLHASATNFNPSAPLGAGNKKLFTNVQATVQPLLTPDPGTHTSMYVDNVLSLIQSAERSVYMQTQYVHPSDKPGDKDFMLLVNALSDAHKKGLDVRLITSEFESTGQWIEKLKEFDLDQVLRIQQGVHNKGIVVDTKTVMVSSQNWSADGCLRNRDAGLIIEQPDIAAYFEKIFLDDWVHRAKEKVTDKSH